VGWWILYHFSLQFINDCNSERIIEIGLSLSKSSYGNVLLIDELGVKTSPFLRINRKYGRNNQNPANVKSPKNGEFTLTLIIVRRVCVLLQLTRSIAHLLLSVAVKNKIKIRSVVLITSTATRSCRDPGTAVIHFWLQGCVRRRPQRVTSAADATRYGRRAATTAGRRRCCWCYWIANLKIKN